MCTIASTSLAGFRLADPAPEEVAVECRAIRSGWSQRKRFIAAGREVPGRYCTKGDMHAESWTAPVAQLAESVVEPWE